MWKISVKASLVLLSILLCNFCAGRVVSMADDGCWRACPHIYDAVCAKDGDSTEIFASECTMEMHNSCFETRMILNYMFILALIFLISAC
jgi:hypothetical protein